MLCLGSLSRPLPAVRRVAVRSYGVAAGYEAAAYVGANPDFTYAAQQQPQQLYGEQVQGGAELIYYGEYNRDCANVGEGRARGRS